MIAHKLSNEQKGKPRVDLVLENRVIRSEIKDPKMEEIKKFTELVKNMPDIRNDRIKTIKTQLQSGQYKISPEVVSEKFIQLYEEICCENL